MARVHSFHPLLHRILRRSAALWFRRRYPVVLTDPAILAELKPPYVLLANHVSMWDVVLTGLLLPHPIHYMASESHFRKGSIRFFLKLLGAFPKAKAKSDLRAIKHMMGLKEQAKAICIYPEGQMSWDGCTMPLFYSTVKLLKLLKIPVYVLTSRGAYASRPRWSAGRRKGPIEMTLLPFSRDGRDLKSQDADALFDRLKTMMACDEFRTIRERGWEYRSKRPAEYLENFLFICPSCGEIASLRSEKERFFCTRCGFAQLLTADYRFLSAGGGSGRFSDPAAWNRWQREALREGLDRYRREGREAPFMADRNLLIRTGYRQTPPRSWTKKGELALFADRLLLRSAEGESRAIPLEEVSGVHVMTRQKLEFYHEKTLYLFSFPDIRLSGYKWLCALRTLGLPSSYAWAEEEPEKI